MPNRTNVSAPIVLISAGRSGTTLFSDIFERHPDCSASGETVDLIFDLWNAGQRSISHVAATSLKDAAISIDDEVGRFVRDGFLSLMEDDRSHWFQKPIGIPYAFSHALFDTALWDEKAEIYWHTMRKVFPQARYFTVLRHPCDIVMSYKNRFGFDERRCWAILGFLSHIICHPSSLVHYAVPYDTLVRDGEATLRALCAHLAIEFQPAMLEAFDTVHSLSAAAKSSSASGFTWESQWDALDPFCAQECHLRAIDRMYRKYGQALDLPSSFVSRTSPDASSIAAIAHLVKSGQADRDETRRVVAELEMRIDNNNLLWEERAMRQDNELYQAYLKLEHVQRAAYLKLEDEQRHAYLSQQEQIEELNADKAWLRDQSASWQEVAAEREKMLRKIESDVAEIEKGKLWLEGQVSAWRANARAAEIQVKELSAPLPVRMARRFLQPILLRLLLWRFVNSKR